MNWSLATLLIQIPIFVFVLFTIRQLSLVARYRKETIEALLVTTQKQKGEIAVMRERLDRLEDLAGTIPRRIVDH